MTEQTNTGAREILTVTGILNYAFLITPHKSKKYPEQPPKFKTSVLFDPTDPQLAAIKAVQRKLGVATWGDQADFRMQKLMAQDKLVLHDGNLADDEQSKGKIFLKSSNKNVVPVYATLGNPPTNVKLEPGHAFFPYSGCKAAVMFEMYVYKQESFVCQLMGVQFLAHGKAFGGTGGGRVATAAEFGINPAAADANIPMQPADVGAASGLM
jgi:hypothetical protein